MTSSYNLIQGTDSGNTLIGSTGADSFVALDGDDNVLAANSNDIVDLGEGQDSVNFTTDPDGASVYGRAGNDSLGITVAINTSTAYGGEGNDTIWLSRGDSQVIYGDAGNDSLEIKMGLKNASVYGGSTTVTSTDGNDSIVLSSSVSNSFIQGNGGNDTMYVGSSVFGGSSVYGGQGVDSIDFVGTVTGSTVGGNLGTDTLLFQDVVKGAAIYGGGGFEYDTSLDGADSISLVGNLASGEGLAYNFAYAAYSDSTETEMDFITIGGTLDNSGDLVFTNDSDTVSAGVASATAVTGTGGIFSFSATSDLSSVSERIAFLDSELESAGDFGVFLDQSSSAGYLFIQGGATDLVVKIANDDAALTLNQAGNAGKVITLELS